MLLIGLNRPEKRNAFNVAFPSMLARLFSGQNTGKLALELHSTRGQT